ncbi:hypothetical protein M3Y97_00174500 [Aphelenchoides bicaudatus]|nr:hypothetical protein M3Y97_00174500 [Aphelenchoides bicaudatus]
MEADQKPVIGVSTENNQPVEPVKSHKKRKKQKTKQTIQEMQRFEYAELNIEHKGDPKKTLQMVRRAIQMGYDTVVINNDVGDLFSPPPIPDQTEEPPTKKRKKGMKKAAEQSQLSQFPDPFIVEESQLDVSQIEANGKKFRQFSRLTVTLTDSTSVHKLQHHSKRALYDIVAIRCPDEQMLATMSRKGEFFDIITLDSRQAQNGRIPWIYKQKLVQACISEGISFEVCYGEALQNNEIRRQFFVNGRALALISNRGRGIILSNGTDSLASLRGPLDVANICTLFGMRAGMGSKLISDNCCKLLLRSQARRTIKGALHITSAQEAPAPASIKREDNLAALLAIPEFCEQMKPKLKLEVSETK